MSHSLRLPVWITLLLLAPSPPSKREEARPWHVRALVDAQHVPPDSALASLERDHFAPAFLARTTRAERLQLVAELSRSAATASVIQAHEDSAGVHLLLQGSTSRVALFQMEPGPPYRITSLRVMPYEEAAPQALGLSWDDLDHGLREAEAKGFAGQLLIRRGGREVLRQCYGLADRAARRRSAPDMVYGIGSTPIDFTIAATQILAQKGALRLDDPIGRFLPDVPKDKRAMTIRMLLEDKSGLPNFHDRKDDWDPDLAWIDRDTAVRRILSQPLLFPPGTSAAHSHSAYVLLSAILELASGHAYQQLLRDEIFQPLGMTRTGFYGESLDLPVEAFAVGYGPSAVGLPNIPPNWGRVSWLVMGSGGMCSTLADMERFYDAEATGALFPDHSPRPRAGVGVGASQRGFYFLRVDDGQGEEAMVLSNGQADSPVLAGLQEGLVKLVLGR